MREDQRIKVTFGETTLTEIERIAKTTGKAKSEIVRDFAEAGMKLQMSEERLDFITQIIRQQLEMLMDGYVERLAALSAKGAIMSATATYLTAETISKFVPLSEQEEFRMVYEKARKKAIAYIHTNLQEK